MTIRSHFSQMLHNRIRELVEKISIDLAHGSAIDKDNYRQQVGRVEGLEDALAIAEQIDKDINGE